MATEPPPRLEHRLVEITRWGMGRRRLTCSCGWVWIGWTLNTGEAWVRHVAKEILDRKGSGVF